MTDEERRNSDAARRYLAALSNAADIPTLRAFFDERVTQREYPNRLTPNGATRDLAALLDGAERGRKVVRQQNFEVKSCIAQRSMVALEVEWSATLAIALGKLAAGDVMRAQVAVVLEFQDGLIVHQRNYDCFEPF